MLRRLRTMVSEVFAARAVLDQLVRQQLILRYRRTLLGYLWTLINPLVTMIITALVFSNLFKMDVKTFAIFMFAGMVPWNFFNAIVIQSSAAFINNEGLIKKIYIPKMLFPLSIAFAALIDSVLSLIALFVIILFIGGQPSWALLSLPLAYLLLFLFSLGIGSILSILTAFYRDLQHIIVIVMQALFFLTPIIYEKSSMSGFVALLLHLNPVTPFIEIFRAPIRYGQWPNPYALLHSTEMAALSLVIGVAFFLWQEKKVIFRL